MKERKKNELLREGEKRRKFGKSKINEIWKREQKNERNLKKRRKRTTYEREEKRRKYEEKKKK